MTLTLVLAFSCLAQSTQFHPLYKSFFVEILDLNALKSNFIVDNSLLMKRVKRLKKLLSYHLDFFLSKITLTLVLASVDKSLRKIFIHSWFLNLVEEHVIIKLVKYVDYILTVNFLKHVLLVNQTFKNDKAHFFNQYLFNTTSFVIMLEYSIINDKIFIFINCLFQSTSLVNVLDSFKVFLEQQLFLLFLIHAVLRLLLEHGMVWSATYLYLLFDLSDLVEHFQWCTIVSNLRRNLPVITTIPPLWCPIFSILRAYIVNFSLFRFWLKGEFCKIIPILVDRNGARSYFFDFQLSPLSLNPGLFALFTTNAFKWAHCRCPLNTVIQTNV